MGDGLRGDWNRLRVCFAELTSAQSEPLLQLGRIDNEQSFRKWGLLRIGESVLLEPYRFVNRCLTLLLKFMREFFRTLIEGIAPGSLAEVAPDAGESDGDLHRFAFPFFRAV